MPRQLNECCYEITWEELAKSFKRFGIDDYCINVAGKVEENMMAKLVIRGTRYYLFFEGFEDLIWFKLKFL